MERLTKKHYGGNGYYMACSEHCNKECFDCKEIDKIIDRLGTYEDAGLEPEDVRRLQKDWTSLIITIDEMGCMPHLRELYEAEKDGRLVVLPCKVGDTVYMPVGKWGTITGYEADECDGFHIARDGVLQIKAKCYSGNHGTYGVPGKTVFLTREEAEAALKGGDYNA